MGKKKQKDVVPVKAPEKRASPKVPVRFILAVTAILLYGSTVNFEFTMDDDLFYQKHQSVQQGLSGFSDFFKYGSMNKFDGTTGVQPYRPAALIAFAFQKDLFDNSAAAAHLVNLLLYVLVVLLFHTLLQRLFTGVHTLLLGIMALFFAVNPLHTEVVASVKSLDELLAACFILSAWIVFTPKSGERQIAPINVLAGSLLFFFGLLSKESAIAFLVIIPLCSYMLGGSGFRSSLMQLLPLLLFSGIFLWLRHQAIGGQESSAPMTILDNVIKGATGLGEELATKMKILFYYLRLAVVPWPLSYDYSFNQVSLAGWSSVFAIAGLILYGALAVLSVLWFKKRPVVSFMILFFFLASSPTNNLFFLNGATVAERFLFLPTLFYGTVVVLLLAYLLKINPETFTGSKKGVFVSVSVVWLVLFAGASFSRVAVWKSNMSLFESGILSAPNSSRTHYNLASECMTQARKAETIEEKQSLARRSLAEFDKSLDIYPNNIQANYNKSICYTLMGDTPMAMAQYKKTISLDARNRESMVNLGILFQGKGMLDSARVYYEQAFRIEPNSRIIRKNLEDVYFFKGIYYNQRGINDSAISCFYNSLIYNPRNTFTLNNISIIHSGRSNFDSAGIYAQRALDTDPNSLMVMENIARIALMTRDYNTAIEFAQRVLRANGRMRKSAGILADSYQAMGNLKEADKYRQLYNSLAN